ncbi:hypothetical protein M422DRAFT_249529 [Sphaerobolus stellatus SS14]|uniref:Unplaced genomic scaffold SPHSTscaffold_30, whole genome shotgun sequence n=1 Tax=Sphaerobolus stellatus (strain SS14) TaxID=990650 RepID=A0A0C9VUW2_SPHS4|nr:hypothetical protein M422DRAFT_249529 [Sphaerobolus stellatus SS14]
MPVKDLPSSESKANWPSWRFKFDDLIVELRQMKGHQDILQIQIDWLNSELKRKADEFETDRSAALEEYIKLFGQKEKLEAPVST